MKKPSNSSVNRPRFTLKLAFVALQVVLIPSLAYAAFFAAKVAPAPAIPALREIPRTVNPPFDDKSVVTDDQLQAVLRKIRFSLTSETPRINHVDHCLRMWGHQVSFDDDRYAAGPLMLSMLTDDRVFRAHWGQTFRPFLLATDKTIRLRTQEGVGSTSHVDHTLATLAEIGLPLGYSVHTRDRRVTLGHLVRNALQRFSLNQAEYEWTAVILGLYSESAAPWTSREGQQITFDRIAQRIMRQPYGQGVCYGEHRLFTLTLLRRIDIEQDRLFSDEVRREIDDHLLEATRRLVNSQQVEGYWDNSWPGEPIRESDELWEQGQRLLATGHALEWWAMAYEGVLPPRETIVRAGQWLAREIDSMQVESVQENLTFLTHAGRALALWRGGTPDSLFEGASLVESVAADDEPAKSKS